MLVVFKSCPQSWGGVFPHIVDRLGALNTVVHAVADPGPDFAGHHDAEVVIPTSVRIDETVMAALPKLRLIQQAGAGLEGVDLRAASVRKILVANVPTSASGAAGAVAEHAIGLMLALHRRYCDFRKAFEQRVMGTPLGHTLQGATVGIIGFGAIGRQIANLLGPFGAFVVAVSFSGSATALPRHVRWLRPAGDLPRLLGEADIVVLACPLKESTRHLLRRDTIQMCRNGVNIVNISRGGLLNSSAILDGLDDGRISGLALDVFESEPPDMNDKLLCHPRVFASPHCAAATTEVVAATASIVAANIVRTLRGQAPMFEVASC